MTTDPRTAELEQAFIRYLDSAEHACLADPTPEGRARDAFLAGAAATALRWSSGPPTVTGYYWWRASEEGYGVIVRLITAKSCGSGQWAGPIPEPEETP